MIDSIQYFCCHTFVLPDEVTKEKTEDVRCFVLSRFRVDGALTYEAKIISA